MSLNETADMSSNLTPETSNKILYISYDGMTDPLGQAQVLPYIIGLTKAGYQFHLISCEKKERFEKYEADIRQLIAPYPIEWHPLFFTTSPPILAKYYDLYQIKKKAFKLQKQEGFSMVHCRSYVSADIGLKLKKKFGVKFFFDMRGFWVDERVDGGMWNLSNPVYKFAYHQYKKKEKAYLENADMIISLTDAGKQEMKKWPYYQAQMPIEVIQCSADFELFQLSNSEKKQAARTKLGIDKDAMVMLYLGTIGTWYLLEEMLYFFSLLKKKHPSAKFLFLTPEQPATIYARLARYKLSPDDLVITFARRQEVPFLACAADFSLCFIKAAYSKISSSPTKVGELLAMGMPIVCNIPIGDLESIMLQTGGGVCVNNFRETVLEQVIEDIPDLLGRHPEVIRQRARRIYDLEVALNRYIRFYGKVLSPRKSTVSLTTNHE